MVNRTLALISALAVFGCASRTPVVVAAPDGAVHGEIAFPRPERERCVAGSRAPYRLSVRVRDEQGGAFPGADVYLFPMGAGGGSLVTVRTNDSGTAIASAAQPGVYAVAAAVGGFEPQIRALTMRAGCTGSATITLKLGPVEK